MQWAPTLLPGMSWTNFDACGRRLMGRSMAMHQACWPTSSSHARLSAVCLVKTTHDNDLNDESNSMSIKTEIMSLRLSEEMIFSLRSRGHANHVGIYTIPYIQAHIFGVGSANTRKCHCPMPERISSQTRSPCT